MYWKLIMFDFLLCGLLSIFLLYLICLFSSISILYSTYKYYKPTYIFLKENSQAFKKVSTSLYCNTKDIIIFDNNSIKLCKDHYLHNAGFTFFCPYSTYYYFKMKKQVKIIRANLNIK